MSNENQQLFKSLLKIVYEYVEDIVKLKKSNLFNLKEYIEKHKYGLYFNVLSNHIKEHYKNVYLSEEEISIRKQKEIEFKHKIENFKESLSLLNLEDSFYEIFDSVIKEIKNNDKYPYFFSSNKTCLIKPSHKEKLKLTFYFKKNQFFSNLITSVDALSNSFLKFKKIVVYDDNLNHFFLFDNNNEIHKIIVNNNNIDSLLKNKKDIKIEVVNHQKENKKNHKLIQQSIEKYSIDILGITHLFFKDHKDIEHTYILKNDYRIYHREDDNPAFFKSENNIRKYYIHGKLVNKQDSKKHSLQRKTVIF